MKKVIFSMKAFYISLFVVLFFPLGLMGQQAINTMINTGNIVCFESNEMMMAVDIYPESHAYAGLPYLSARAKNDQVWGDMTIWWEATNKGFRNLTYGCYLKLDSINKTYAVAMYEDPDGDGPGKPRAYSEAEATSIGFVTATSDAKILVHVKKLFGSTDAEFDDKSSWYLGKISYSETIKYQYRTSIFSGWKNGTYTHEVNEYYRPQYKSGKWIAGTNIAKRNFNGYDRMEHDKIMNYTSIWDLSSFLDPDDIRNADTQITYSPTIILGGVEFGVVKEGLISIDMRTMMAFFCPPTDAQAYMLNNFNIVHQKGASAPAAPVNEYQVTIENLQPVHTHTEVIYAAEGADVHLRLQVEDTRSYPLNWNDMENSRLYQYTANKYLDGYYRWFNYKNENNTKTINDSLKHIRAKATFGMQLGETEEFKYFKTNKGDVLLKGFGPGKTTFKMGKDSVKIACDVSNYSDYKFSFINGVITCTEPTLSYRIIYDIRPASEMAAKLDAIKGDKGVDDKTPFESYNIVAPAGENIKIGPKHRWYMKNPDQYNADALSPSNYFYTYSGKVTKIKKNHWHKDRSTDDYNYGEVIDERLITVTAPADGVTEIYEFYNWDRDIKIAEFKVTGRAKEKVGPWPFEPNNKDSIHFPDYIDDKYLDLSYNQTFDRAASYLFEDPLGVNVTENEAEDNWNEISYGFVYYDFDNTRGDNSATKVNPNNPNNDITKTKRGRLGHANKVYMPHWSEYFFAVNTSGLQPEIFNVISHGSTPKCDNRYLYCSGTSTPGKVADFVINGNLCPASKIFLSAWVVHMYDVKYITNSELGDAVYPNLNFSIIGIMKDGTETPISTFTTGDIKENSGKWHHILFEFETTQVDYDQYRIRIENNNASLYNIGNEFGIDDIRVYTTTKTAATVNQKFMGCPTWDVKNPTVIGKSNIALLRADLSNTPSGNTTMYYSWLKAEGANDDIVHLQLSNYLGNNTIGGSQTLYGDVEVNKDWADADVSGRLYATIDAYLSEKATDLQTDVFADYFFTREDGDLILYIVHKDIRFQQNEKYYSIVTADKARVEEHNTAEKVVELYQNLQCGTLSSFEVLPYSRAFLTNEDGEKYDYDFTETVIKHLADGETYNFVVEAYSPGNVDDGEEPIVSYNCAADWLLVNGMTESEKWTNVNRIIKWRKGETGYSEPTDLGDKLTKDVTSNEITMSETEPFMHYVVIPYPGSTKVDGEPCVVPFELLLYDSIPATLADPTINNNKVDEPDRPEAICNEPIIVRIPNSLEGKDNFTLNLDIDYFDEYLFAEIAKYNEQEGNTNLYPLNNIYLYDANGQPVATPIKFNITTTAKDENNQTLTLDLLKKDDDVTISGGHAFESGKKYHFAGHNVVNGVTITPPFQFDVYVVPDEVVWTGDEGTAWHNDANWNPAIIPMSHTNVVIPGNTTNKPVLKPSATEFEAGAYEWLEHDIVAVSKGKNNLLVDDLSAVLNSCKDIYFEAGAQLANQHMLNYERAFVDVPFTGNGNDDFGKSIANYKIMSFPLRDVYRGDLYIPKAGDGTFAFANAVAKVDNRAYNSFYVKAYNSAIKKNTISGDKTKPEAEKVVEVTDYTYDATGGWSNPTSVLNFEFEEAHGYAVSLNATTEQSFVRLPKSATEYYLFMDFGSGTEEELNGPTWPKYEIPREVDDNGQEHDGREFAHKLVYDKSHCTSVTFENKKGNIFLIGNPFMTGMNVKEFLAGNTNLNSEVYYTYEDGNIVGNKVQPNATPIIPPFGAMFVKGRTDDVKQTFEFTSAMMSYKQSSEPSTQQNAPRMVEVRELLTITAEVDGARSRTYIEKDFAANNEYLDTEDADLLVLDADLTPISVYSVATGAALAYNSVTDMEFVPLGLLLVDSTIVAESVRFTFDGVDYFYDELYLYDAFYNSYLPLIDGVALELEIPESGELRYFITDTKHNVGGGVTTSDDLVEGSKVCVFTTEGEACIIAEDIISEATVYDIAGRLIYYSDQISSSQHNISLPNGVYMLKVVVNSNLSTHKIILK